jgi:CubicO group peptidase (beta-lactamase class C family)
MKIKQLIFLLVTGSILLSSCSFCRFFYWNLADINDYKKFRYMTVSKPESPFIFSKSKLGLLFDTVHYNDAAYTIDYFFEHNKSAAALIIKDDSILYENYFMGRDQASYVPSFSASKSIVSALVGIAIADGSIKSVQDPITDYLPELKENDERFSKITIEHLLNMQSGILYKEKYLNPFSDVAKGYYGLNLLGQLKNLKIKKDPGIEFDYISFNSQLLAFIVERATGKKLPEYLQEKIWKPCGMEYDATWSVDSKKNKEAKAFCCLNAVARDYAKFGRLYLNGGNWNGKQIVPKDWVEKSVTYDESGKTPYYSYQWWHYYNNDFFAQGLLGQYIYVYPSKKIIIVRLGKSTDINWPAFFSDLCESL